jgi:carbonic anhydrase/acetyltransferase-like protein (isoleucine patch superfamily)
VALMDWLPRAATPDRIGIHVVKLGVWAGLHTHIAPGAELHAPCWIGDNVHIGDGAIVGPNVVIEEKSFVEPRARICDSHIGPDTFVGAFTDVENSIALGCTLISWKYDSVLKVPDEFLLCSLEHPQASPAYLLKPSSTQPQPEWSWKFNAKTEL